MVNRLFYFFLGVAAACWTNKLLSHLDEKHDESQETVDKNSTEKSEEAIQQINTN